jgi:GNAT superfamily N-acetyltransferase
LDIVRYNNAVDLLTRCEDILISQEAENNNLIQLLQLIVDDSGIVSPPYWFASVDVDGAPIGCCVHALPDGLVATALPSIAARPLYHALVADIPPPSRIVGRPSFARSLAQISAIGAKRHARLSSRWLIYRLDKVNEVPDPAHGELRLATSEDYHLVEQWGNAYGDERPSFLNVHDFMLSKLESGELYFWNHKVDRTMLTVSGRGMNAQRISSVFTPKEFRGRGYASTAVAAVSQELLNNGSEYVVLTAGLGEPVARIYERIGFSPVGDRHSYTIS